MILVFELSMPGVASWNGKWSGEKDCYAVVRSLKNKELVKRIVECGSYSYRWDDGWSAMVTVKVVTSVEANKIRKKSKGFCGYDWMVDSIIKHQKICIT